MIRLRSNLKHPFHAALATPEWLRRLEEVVRARIQKLGGFETLEAEGEVGSRYGEDRFMGPNSLCKFDFDVVARVKRLADHAEPDEYGAVATYDPDRRTFSTQYERRSIRRLQAAVAELIEQLSGQIRGGAPLERIDEARCPWCAGPILISFHPEGKVFALSCKADGTHLSIHKDTPTPPPWWKERVTNRWLSSR
jgi:hypothetical protein